MTHSTHWSNIQERGSVFGMRLLLAIYKLAGRRVLLLVLSPVVFYFYVTGTRARQASASFLQRVKAVKPATPTGFWVGYQHFLSFANSAFDKVDAWLGKITSKDIHYTNPELFQALNQDKRGAIFIGSHLGNLEVCRALNASKYNTPINVLVFTQHAIKFNALLQKVNPDVGINMIEVSELGPDLMILLKEKIDAGESLVIVGDRTSTSVAGRVSYAPFLGQDAPFSQGPFILAALLECPVYLLFCFKQHARYHVIFERFSDQLSLPRKTRKQTLANVINTYAARLEHHALAYPLQWFNFYDFWQQDEHVARQATPKER